LALTNGLDKSKVNCFKKIVTKKPPSRPGGRSQRVRDAVFAAVEALMAQNKGALPSMADIAARADVNPTSLYRRWGDAKYLAAEVAFDRLNRDFPVPDTGTLRGDMLGWASAAARHLSERKNSMLLRIVAADAQSSKDRALPIEQRGQELEIMLERARARGEAVPDLLEVFEIVMAPIYSRLLFFGPIREPAEYAARLVDRALALAATRVRKSKSR
jgi:AcrR family transcriptional regulator